MATVLVVEDDKLSQRILSKMLSGAGHVCLLASSVSEGWAALRQNICADLVILDNQLGHDWGWQFLEALREDVLYRELPVVVYTGHTERSSILRYVELGVKSMLVKPYKADIVFEEVAKAVKADWASTLLEDPMAACARLQIKEGDYYSVLSAGANVLENVGAELRRLTSARPDDAKIRPLLQQLLSQSVTLGMPALRSVTEALVKGLGTRNQKLVQNCLESVDALRNLLRNRALAHVGIENVTTARTGPGASAAAPKPAAPLRNPSATSTKKFYIQKTAAAPLFSFGGVFERLARNSLPAEDLEQLLASAKTKSPYTDFQQAVNYLGGGAQSASFDDFEKSVKADPDFERFFLELVGRLSGRGPDTEVETDVALAINRVGLNRTIVLISVRALAAKLRGPALLDLQPLRLHTLSSIILSQEIGRMLGLDDDLLVAAAGTAHAAGSWFFALEEPGIYSVALARADATGESIAEMERALFGVNNGQAARALLEAMGAPETVRLAAEYYLDPAALPAGPRRALTTSVHLAHELAWAVLASEEASIQPLAQKILSAEDAVWQLLQEDGVQLPMDTPEFSQALITAALNAVRMAQTLASAGA
jgi:CheY-like chemotaxis protein